MRGLSSVSSSLFCKAMCSQEVNQDYTKMWTRDGFTIDRAAKYEVKFHQCWEKNWKHVQQIAFAKKYLTREKYWCDFPVGSGRLMAELQTEKMIGVDISESFLELNRAKGIECEKADLFNHQYADQFEVLTSLHTLGGFDDTSSILRGYIKALKSNGILITDVPNGDRPSATNGSFRLTELRDFFGQLGCEIVEAQYHDFYDNRWFLEQRGQRNGVVEKIWQLINRAYFSRFSVLSKPTKWALTALEKMASRRSFEKILVAVKKAP